MDSSVIVRVLFPWGQGRWRWVWGQHLETRSLVPPLATLVPPPSPHVAQQLPLEVCCPSPPQQNPLLLPHLLHSPEGECELGCQVPRGNGEAYSQSFSYIQGSQKTNHSKLSRLTNSTKNGNQGYKVTMKSIMLQEALLGWMWFCIPSLALLVSRPDPESLDRHWLEAVIADHVPLVPRENVRKVRLVGLWRHTQ